MRSPRPMRCAAGALVPLLLLAGASCGSDQDPAVSGPTASTASTATTAAGDGSGGSSTTTTAEAGEDADVHVVEVTVAGGEPEGGARTESVDAGTEVELRIASDTEDEVHVHGYDLEVALHPGETATLRFTADLPGRWEIELHEAGVELLQLEVRG